MALKNITLTGAEIAVTGLDGSNAAIRNDGADTIYTARQPGITPGADGVLPIPAGGSAVLKCIAGAVYFYGTGAATLDTSDYNDNPFKGAAQGGSGAADEVARAAINEHAGNTEIHVTADDKANWNAKANISDIPDIPASLPANGGNAATVNGHTVNADVPANAKFTDTIYTHPTSSGNKHIPAGGSSGQILRWASNGTAVWGADNNTTYGAASPSANGLMTTGAQTFGGNKTFNGQILPNGAAAYGTPQARKLSSGTAAATTANCPAGAWYGQHG